MALTDEQTLYNVTLDLIGDYRVTENDTTSKQYLACTRNYAKARDEMLISHLWNEAITRSMVLQQDYSPIHGYSYKYQKPTDCLRVVSIGTDLYEWRVEGDYILTNHIVEPDEWAEGEFYTAGQYVARNNITYLCNTSHQSAIAWETGKTYNVGNRVISSSTYYICAIAHTSGTFATDLASVYWTVESDDDPDTNTTLWTTQNGEYGYIELEYVKQLTTITEFSPRLYNAITHYLAIKIITSLSGDVASRNQLLKEYEQLVLPQARSVDAAQGTPRVIYNSFWKRSRR